MKMLLNDLSSFLWKLLFSVCSLSPIFALTKDSSYGFNSDKPTENEIFRLSLINLRLGFVTYYFFTGKFKICDKKTGGDWQSFSMPKITRIDTQLFAKITLENCQWNNEKSEKFPLSYSLSRQEIDDEVEAELECLRNNHKSMMLNSKFKGYSQQHEFLLYLIQNEKDRKNIASVKVGLYAAAMLVLVPESFSLIFSEKLNIISYLLLYFLMNVLVALFHFLKVSSLFASSFGELRSAQNPKQQLLSSYYFDWQSQKLSAQQAVGRVKTIETIFITSVVLSLVLGLTTLLLIDFQKVIDSSDIRLQEFRTSENDFLLNEVSIINFEKLEDPFSQESIQYTQLHLNIAQSKPEYVVVLCNESDYFWVMEEFEKYDQEVRLIILNDLEQQAGRMKIGIGD